MEIDLRRVSQRANKAMQICMIMRGVLVGTDAEVDLALAQWHIIAAVEKAKLLKQPKAKGAGA